MQRVLHLTLLIYFLCIPYIAIAQTHFTIAAGNWNDPAVWNGGNIPNNSISFLNIEINHPIIINVDADIWNGAFAGFYSTLNIKSGGRITVSSGRTFTVNNIYINNSISFSLLYIIVEGNLIIKGEAGSGLPDDKGGIALFEGYLNINGGTVSIIDNCRVNIQNIIVQNNGRLNINNSTLQTFGSWEIDSNGQIDFQTEAILATFPDIIRLKTDNAILNSGGITLPSTINTLNYDGATTFGIEMHNDLIINYLQFTSGTFNLAVNGQLEVGALTIVEADVVLNANTTLIIQHYWLRMAGDFSAETGSRVIFRFTSLSDFIRLPENAQDEFHHVEFEGQFSNPTISFALVDEPFTMIVNGDLIIKANINLYNKTLIHNGTNLIIGQSNYEISSPSPYDEGTLVLQTNPKNFTCNLTPSSLASLGLNRVKLDLNTNFEFNCTHNSLTFSVLNDVDLKSHSFTRIGPNTNFARFWINSNVTVPLSLTYQRTLEDMFDPLIQTNFQNVRNVTINPTADGNVNLDLSFGKRLFNTFLGINPSFINLTINHQGANNATVTLLGVDNPFTGKYLQIADKLVLEKGVFVIDNQGLRFNNQFNYSNYIFRNGTTQTGQLKTNQFTSLYFLDDFSSPNIAYTLPNDLFTQNPTQLSELTTIRRNDLRLGNQGLQIYTQLAVGFSSLLNPGDNGGDLDLNGQNIELMNPFTGILDDYGNNSLITDKSPNLNENNPGGCIIANNRDAANYLNINSLGISLSNTGIVSIRRYHYLPSHPTAFMMRKVFQISGANPTNATMTLYFAPDEVNFAPSPYGLYRYNGTNWIAQGATISSSGPMTTVELNGINQFSSWSAGSPSLPLPVGLIKFEAQRIDNQQVKLFWQTAQEIQNKGFWIEESLDGNQFISLKFVEGLGNSSTGKNYYFILNNSLSAYYRLNQIDFDEKKRYSTTIYVKGSETDFQIFPNPTINQVDILSPFPFNQTIECKVTDVQGKIIWQGKGELLAIKEKMNDQLINWKSGVYVINIYTSQRKFMTKLLKK
jgi:hypothetical protein